MHAVPEPSTNDGLMLPGIGCAFINGLADVDPVVEQLVEGPLVDRLAVLRRHPLRDERTGERGGGAHPHEALEDHAYRGGLRLVDHQLAVADVVAERRPSAHPDPSLSGGRELVADALADDLALELGEGEQ